MTHKKLTPAMNAAGRYARARLQEWTTLPGDSRRDRLHRRARQARCDMYEIADQAGENPRRFEAMADAAYTILKTRIEDMN